MQQVGFGCRCAVALVLRTTHTCTSYHERFVLERGATLRCECFKQNGNCRGEGLRMDEVACGHEVWVSGVALGVAFDMLGACVCDVV